MSDVTTVNPASEETLAQYQFHSENEVANFVEWSDEAFCHWRKLDLQARLDCVADFAQALNSARHPLAELMTREMGKTWKESLAEVDKSVASCNTLCALFPQWLNERNYTLPTGYHVTHEPLGVLLGIMPWNFPLWQVLRFAIPAALCGNSILLKHAPNTWGSAEFIESLFAQAFPNNIYINLKVDVPAIGRLLEDARVAGVSLTGSRQAGSKVGAQAGANLKKAVLELGGSDAYVILEDADVAAAAEICIAGRLVNAGQSCVAAKRFIVTKKNAQEFTEKMRSLLSQKKFGDPMQSTTDFGPLARADLRSQLHAQVEASCKAGACLELGGKMPSGKGFFYPATLLSAVRPGQPAFDEELFGPVASVIEADSEVHALSLANRSRYGLGAAIFSRDRERALHLARTEIEAGMIFINDFVRSDVTVPFGGVKDSGLGRELGKDGCFEFTNTKLVYARPEADR